MAGEEDATKKAAEKPEEEQTNEERLAWLRARGVIVEEPPGRKIFTAQPDGRPCFKFVKIPLDENAACEELACPQADGDALPAFLAPRFASGVDSLTDDQLVAFAASSGQSVSPAALRSVMLQGGAESFRLATPTDDNGRQDVYAYLDEASSMKNLPLNPRAYALASKCGFPTGCTLSGDIYIGRRQWKEGGLVSNVDFALSELNYESPWIIRAPRDNLEFQMASNPEGHDDAQRGIDKAAEGEGDGYRWQDQGEEVEIVVTVEKGTQKKDVKVDFKKQEIRMAKPFALTLKLWKPVDPDGCNWTLGDGNIVLTLEKCNAGAWSQLLQE